MKSKICLILLFLVINASGCGQFMMRGSSMQTTQTVAFDQPLKGSKKEALSIRTIAIYSPIHMLKSDEGKRLYMAKLDVLMSELKKSNRFRLVTPSTVNRTADKLGLLQDLELMSEEEMNEEFAKVASALGANAMLLLGSRQEKIAMGANFMKYLFEGKVSIPVVQTLTLVSTKTHQVLWEQEHRYTYDSGKLGILNMPEEELKNMVRPVIIPLTQNLMESLSS